MKRLIKYNLRFIAITLLLLVIGCSDDEPINPTADFTYEVDSSNTLLVSFEAIATNGRTLAWEFGDGGLSIAKNTKHTFTSGGSYDVKLTIYGEEGSKSAIVIKTISVIENPTAKFSYELNDLTVSFTSTTTGAVSFAWDFGDGETSTNENPVHSYAAYGDYIVSLNVTGMEGSTPAVVTKTVSVQEIIKNFEPVIVGNADFELPGTSNRIKDWASIPGWSSDATTVDSGVEINGWWANGNSTYAGVLFSNDTSAYNQTEHIISEGEEFKLQLDAIDIWNGPKFNASLISIDSNGNRNIISNQVFNLVSGQWNSIELTAIATPGSVGGKLGIEVSNTSGDGGDGWTGFDNVQLFVK